ncbi:Sugar phosphate isomerase/epimerase [Palleronia marisminoris]|uniref:Inosose dehydratase n=1 Tax=Palleronia marisminoris TaxID=315423 RepID=A0A1Y5S5D9_9RHOB|nr:sugar phosphate isomerase/epimerase [Palleronia marisminoris]SFG63720.1 Sugar phosphate isomerase/epimerase [Palleronia marisminoris]SLN32481.1 Inosose dehydratase [Palleronia marisminoris]
MKTIKGPGLFLAQFVGDTAPFNSFEGLTAWAAECGYAGVQVPTIEARLMDLDRAATSRDYADELKGKAGEAGVEITELAAHMQGQLVAVNPAYDAAFDGFVPEAIRGKPDARTEWAVDQMRKTIDASANLGLTKIAAFSGALAWPFVYPWPQRPAGLIETAFDELARRWRPIFDHAEEKGVDVCFELHPGEDLHDGISYEMFLDRVDQHPRARLLYDPSHFVLQGLDYLDHIDIYAERISMFHVKDAEFRPNGRQGVYGGYQGWVDRVGRFRSPGDGQVDFGAVFSKLTSHGFDGWAVVEWECALKHPEDGAREGAAFTRDHIIRVTDRAFDDFAGGGSGDATNRKLLGL